MNNFLPPYYGAAYYPESWPREEIDKDLDRLQSHGLNTVRIAEFAWSNMEPVEGKYDFSLFREVVDKCKERGISVIMCTPSATPPSWMAHKHPDIFAKADEKRAIHGHRRMTCPTNAYYRKACADIVEAMAKEFASDENIIGWQIDNELNVMSMGTGCNCDDCTRGFRSFLKERYGTIDELNDAWGHYTWSMNFSSFDEVDPFTTQSSQPAVHKYMWELYKSLSTSDFCRAQADIIRKYTNKPIGTDMMPFQQLDIAETNSHLDVIQFNYYGSPASLQFWQEAYRSQKDRPMWLTETASCWSGSNSPNAPRIKGYCKVNTLMSFANGSEMVLYWLFRTHRGGYEMAHGSVVDTWGRDMQCSDEIREISRDLKKLTPMLRGTRPANTGLAISFGHLPYVADKYASFETYGMKYPYTDDLQNRIFAPIAAEHFRPDVISPYADLTPYKMLITHRHLTLDEGDFLDRIMPWVENGGTWVVGPYTDIYTKDLAKHKNAPFGHLEDWANVTRAYYIPAPTGAMGDFSNIPLPKIVFEDGLEGSTVNNLNFDALVPGEGVKVRATYAEGFDYLSGYAAITETKVGKGRIILVGAALDQPTYRAFIKAIAAECGIFPITTGSDAIRVNLHKGDYGEVFTAIDCGAHGGKITIPFNSTDILTGEKYTKGQEIEMERCRCIFAKKE